MSNKSLRKTVQKILNKRHLGPLYIGSAHTANKILSDQYLISLLKKLKLREGDVVNDCDMLNHRIKHLIVETALNNKIRFPRRAVHYIYICGAVFLDGSESCGCGTGFEEGLTREEIRRRFVEMWVYQEKTSAGRSWLPTDLNSPYQKWKRGEKWEVCDENGFKISNAQK